MTPEPNRGTALSHEATLEPYRTVVARRWNGKRAVWGTRYLVRCSCGWDVAGSDYINAKRLWKEHRGV